MADSELTVVLRPLQAAGNAENAALRRRHAQDMSEAKATNFPTIDDIVYAVFVLAHLRFDSEQSRRAKSRGEPAKPLEWPLSTDLLEGLGTAIQCLNQYAEVLGRQRATGL